MILRCITLAGSRCLRGWETRSVHALAMCWRGAVLRHSCRRCWLSGYPVGDMKKVWKGFKGIDWKGLKGSNRIWKGQVTKLRPCRTPCKRVSPRLGMWWSPTAHIAPSLAKRFPGQWMGHYPKLSGGVLFFLFSINFFDFSVPISFTNWLAVAATADTVAPLWPCDSSCSAAPCEIHFPCFPCLPCLPCLPWNRMSFSRGWCCWILLDCSNKGTQSH